ncbi:hypothetical protein, partial [Klebsiella aerogenes]|jgi:hypothetical protein|uniref:hypothetical protein n=1 Tax=Klebsiella aerogenes TaxID=548 RepID=UPI0019540F32
MTAPSAVNEMANRIACAIGKDVSAKAGFRERVVRWRPAAPQMTLRASRSASLEGDAATKIVSSRPHTVMERMTPPGTTFEIPFH